MIYLKKMFYLFFVVVSEIGQTPQRRDFGFPRFLASTSPHERIIERFREERGPYKTDDEDDDPAAEFSQLSRRHTADSKASAGSVPANGGQSAVHRSASMNDLADPEAAPSSLVLPGFRTESLMNPLHRALSVEGSLNAPNTSKDNKENFAVPQDPSGSKKLLKQSATSSGRKILNAQNAKTTST